MSPVSEFGDIAKRLAYNPLGIIALFIVLCYAIACLLFGFAAQHLEPNERCPLIWFVVGFPILVLLVFAWLVVKHHTKLYAPKDFPDSTTYLRTLGIDEQKKKIELEVAEVTLQTPSTRNVASKPQEQNIRRLLFLAEDLVMRELQDEFSVVINRQVAVGSKDAGFDGMFVKENEAYVVEVKLVSTEIAVSRLIESVTQIRNYVAHLHWRRVKCILAIVVVDASQKGRVEEFATRELLQRFPDFLLVRVYAYDELAKKYGLGEDKP